MCAEKPSSVQLLIVGHEAVLLDTRKLILRQRGFAVHTAQTREECAALVTAAPLPYRLWILCHTVSEDDRDYMELFAQEANSALYRLSESIEPLESMREVEDVLFAISGETRANSEH